ncbi:MAG: histidine kinase dimerization/phospho-acceptor domain-containing protein, partial [Spirochaetota bacterium]
MKIRYAPVTIALLFLLLPLIVILALLQYHWLGEVSVREEERMRAGLWNSAMLLRNDFTEVLSGISLILQMEAAVVKGKNWASYADQYKFWLENAAFPRLVKEICLLEGSPGQTPEVYRFDPASERFRTVTEADNDQTIQLFQRLWQGDSSHQNQGIPNFPWALAEIPALSLPIFETVPYKEDEQNIRFAMGNAIGAICVILDRTFMEEELLPSLVRRHFSPDNQLRDYNIQIVDTDHQNRIIYQSSSTKPGWSAFNMKKADIALPFLTFQTGGVVFQNLPSETVSGVTLPSNLNLPGIVMWLNRNKSQADMAEAAAGPIQAFQSVTSRVFLSRAPGVELDVTQPENVSILDEYPDSWILFITHRAGSLKAAVQNNRNRNLAVSFGILVILGLSVVVLYMSYRRAKTLTLRERDFMAAVSHELKTPLSVICSAGENLSDGLVKKRDQVQSYGRILRQEGKRLQDMVDKILLYAGI